MDGIYTNGLTASGTQSVRERDSRQELPAFQTGEIIEGVITSVSDRVSVNFSGKEYTFPSEAVQNAREGEIRTYKIMEASGASFVLKEIGTNETAGGQGILFTAVETDPQVMSECLKGEEKGNAKEEEDRLDEIANRMTEEDYKELNGEGMTLERYNLERLERVLERLKTQKEIRRAGEEGQKERLSLKRDATEKTARKNAVTKLSQTGRTELIAERLEAVDLPVTDSNVARIAEAMNLAEEAQYMTEASFSYLIGNQLEPTLEACYKAVHAGAVRTEPLSDTVFEELMPQVGSVIENAGLEQNTAAVEDARWLIEKNLPLTADNLQYKQELEQLTDDLNDGTLSEEALLNGTVEQLSRKEDPRQLNLIVLRQKEEIRLQLTEEVSDKMQQLGVETDTKAIKDRIEALKKEEAEYYKSLLKEIGTVGDRPEELLEQTLQTTESLKAAPVSLLAVTFSGRSAQTLNTLAVQTESLMNRMASIDTMDGETVRNARFTAAEAGYEALMTKPRSDMGDSIHTAFRNVDDRLAALNLETTEANRRAVRILGYNSIPLTEENITSMKYYDSQVTGLIEKLQPSVVTGLIREGINPLTTELSTLETEVDRIVGEEGTTAEEKYSEYLVKLDDRKELTKEERAAYVQVYRTIYRVEKSDGAVIGALAESGREITLQNLMTEARTMKSSGIDTLIGDETGIAESSEAVLLAQKQFERIAGHFTPDRAEEIRKTEAPETMSLERLAEQLEQLPEGDGDLEYSAEQVNHIRELAEDCSLELRFLERLGTGNSVEALTAARSLLQGGSWMRRLERLVQNKSETLTADDAEVSPETVMTVPSRTGKDTAAGFTVTEEEAAEVLESREKLSALSEQTAGKAQELMEALYLNAELTAEEAGTLREIAGSVSLYKELAGKEYYEIPIGDEDGDVGLRLTVIHNSGSSGQFSVLMDGEEGGSRIRAEAGLKDNTAELLITSDSRVVCDAVRSRQQVLKNRLQEQGIDCEQVFVGFTDKVGPLIPEQQRDGTSGQQSSEEESTGTELLYRAAKETVLFLRTIIKS